MEMVLRAVGFLLFLGVVFGLLELAERVMLIYVPESPAAA